MNIQNRPIPSIQQVQSEHLASTKVNKPNNLPTSSFGSILQQKLQEKEPIKFSKHANMRLDSRNIKLTDEQILKIQNGISKAEEKGIKESLVLIDNIALVVNIENKTVVTALDQQETRDYVFTNIDGAVVL
ncbi:MAG: flagellar biosynthesis protein [Firmicutes bacterium HGW-Firmicutes-1]|jgi:flagellar operon protein|nr:MAG: flagellar biosynthesis protein [Firmicutes bacterium HGW-Firmicutes-1]